MNTQLRLSALVFCFVISFSVARVQAQQSCTVPPHDNVADGTSFYQGGICNQERVNYWWSVYDMQHDSWDQGFGFDDPCNLDLPLGRTFAAMYLLTYSAEDYAKKIDDFSGNALRWAHPYAATHSGNVQALCFKPGSSPGDWNAWAYGSRIEFYLPYFYNLDVASRAGTLLHEARHNGGKGHNGGSGCPRAVSCDTTWGYQGANMYQVLYLWWFGVDGTRTTSAIRNMGLNRARAVHNSAFNTNPGFNI